jgi:hypothetical protein
MKYKKEVAAKMVELLKKEINKLNDEIRHNAWKINDLGEKNAVLKRERNAIARIIGEWEKC